MLGLLQARIDAGPECLSIWRPSVTTKIAHIADSALGLASIFREWKLRATFVTQDIVVSRVEKSFGHLR